METAVMKAKSIAINVSRELIQDEVRDSVESIQTQINSIEQNLITLRKNTSEKEVAADKRLKKISKKLLNKEKFICQVLDYQVDLQDEVDRLQKRIKQMELSQTEREKSPIRAFKSSKKKSDKFDSSKKAGSSTSKQRGEVNVQLFENTTGVPEWVLKLKGNKTHWKGFCSNRKNASSVLGVPKWVRDLNFKKYQQQCLQEDTEYNVYSSYTPVQGGYTNDDSESETETETEKSTSRKSTKRIIDEAFLTLMMRSKRVSWIDIERLGDNIGVFVDQVTEIGKLCSVAAVSMNWDRLEKCKEQIGMNFASMYLL